MILVFDESKERETERERERDRDRERERRKREKKKKIEKEHVLNKELCYVHIHIGFNIHTKRCRVH